MKSRPHPDTTDAQRSIRIAIALFDAVEELDWVGPWEVLSVWAKAWPDDGVEIFTVADSLEPVTCAKGVRVLADRTWRTAGRIDVLVYPGGRGARAQVGDPRIRRRLRSVAARGALMTSVCTGSLVYADAGILNGRAATTHWSAVGDLAALGNAVAVRPDARIVDTGPVITSAGVSAGIDMALHLIARLHSIDRAREVRRHIQYDPEPPV